MEYDIESILEKYEDDYTPAIGPRAMVGEITEEQTQFGRPIYQTPSGEKVSEKSTTLFLNGNWMNVPSIHGGKSFNENELRLMIKQGNIEPTSVHKSKDDAEAAAKARSDSMVQGPRSMYNQGQLVSNTVDGSRPGYSGKPPTTKHLGNGVYEMTHERGSKTYYGKYERNKKSFKKSFGNNKEAAENFVNEGKKTPVAKNIIDIQSESGTLLQQPKYKANLRKALDQVSALQEKGYGNIDSIAKKYQKVFTQKIGSKTRAGKIIKTGTGSTEYKAITFAINEHAKKLNIQSIENPNVIKALDAYSKIKNPKRGNIPKILKKFNVPEGSFSKYLNTLNLRKKIPLKFGSEAAKRRYYGKVRNDAIREFSSNKFEKFLIAPETALVQKSHMGDLYNQYVRTGNLGYAPNLINQETLKTVDTALKDYNKQINDLLKNKPKGYRDKVDLLNQQGNDLAAATQGYKKFTGRDPFTGKEFTLNFSKPGQELDPTDLLENKKLSDLTAADKPTLEILKKDAMKNATLSKTKTNSTIKQIEKNMSDIEKRLTTISKAGGKKGKAAIQALAILAGSTVAAVSDDGSEGTGGMLKDAAIAGGAVGTVGTKAGRKLLGNLFNAAGLPASLAFNYFAGIDGESSLDRTILGFELATAKDMIGSAVKTTNKIKSPILRKAAELVTTINPKYALNVAKKVGPIGKGIMGGELAYKVATESNPNMLRDKQGNALFDVDKADTLFSNMLMQSDKKFLPEDQYKKQYGDKEPDLPELFIEKEQDDSGIE